MKAKNIFCFFGILVVMGLMLTGCGGGSGGSKKTTTPTPQPSTVQTINSEIQKQGADWVAAENPISQLPDDKRKQLEGLIPEATGTPRISMRNALESSQLPASLDWRAKDNTNWMTSIKDQGQCGSCVSFASLGVVESLYQIANNNSNSNIDLSESDLFSCGGGMCYVGWDLFSASNRLKNTGVVDEACLPYQVKDNMCSQKCANWQSRTTKINSWVSVPSDGTSIKNYLLQGPVLAGIAVYTDFFYYKSGTYKHVLGSMEGRHAISIVGYNDQGGYWIVRNSWGSSWGEAGYVKIKYGEVEIESRVVAMQMSGISAGVTATASPTSITLSGGQAQTTLTCATNGSISTLEGRCNSSDSWSTISSGNTKTCSYSNAGMYTPACRVNGIVTDNVDTSVTVTTGNQPPTASISANPISGPPPLTVNFTWTCSDADGTCVSYLWNFGDGTPTDSQQNPSHIFTATGTYSVMLTVTDDDGAVNSQVDTSVTVTTGNQPPTASISANPISGSPPLTVNFTGTCSDTDGTCVSYLWNFGDGTPTDSQQNPSHTFIATGTYNVVLTVTDDDDATGQYYIAINVNSLPSQAQKISAGYYHTCALTTNGGVKCWGMNALGQLGDGTTTDRTTPVAVSGLTSGVIAIAAGMFHTCVLTSEGSVKCWGTNGSGQLGDGTTTDRIIPVAVSGLTSGVTAISVGGFHTCALTTNGGVKCWGVNSYGQIGDGTTTDRLTPVAVSGLTSGVSTIATGDGHTCAIISSGGVKCWGYNNGGRLGDGTEIDRTTPVAVSGLTSGAIAITTGYNHTCAITNSGGVKCWGWDADGQLGDYDTVNKTTPVAVNGLASGIAAISAGGTNTCALDNSGSVKCWGDNSYGQIGDGSVFSYKSHPIAVSGLTSGVTAITTGTGHTCVLTNSGGIKCWGFNKYGELSDGTTTNRCTPTDVVGF